MVLLVGPWGAGQLQRAAGADRQGRSLHGTNGGGSPGVAEGDSGGHDVVLGWVWLVVDGNG